MSNNNVGNPAYINIKVNLDLGKSEERLKTFFENLDTKAKTSSETLKGLTTSLSGLTATITAASQVLDKLTQKIIAVNTSLHGTVHATNQATSSIHQYNRRVDQGVALTKLGVAANLKYAESISAIARARRNAAVTGVTREEAARARENARRTRDRDIFSEALGRARLSRDPLRDHFRQQAETLSKQVVSGAKSAQRAIREYNLEVAKFARQGAFKNEAQRLQTLEAMTRKLARAQRDYNKEKLKESVGRGRALADPREVAAEALRRQMVDLSNAVGKGVISKKQAAAAANKLHNEFNKTYSVMGRFQTRMGEIGQRAHTMSLRFRDAGRQLMMFGTIALAALLPIIKANAQFEQSVRNVSAVLGSVGDKTVELRRLSEQFLHLGERSEFTANQIAEGAVVLARAGFNAREVQGALSGVVNLASAANISLEDSARIAANITRAFKMSADSFDMVAGKIVAIAVNSNAAVQDIAESFKYVSPIAASFGQSIDSVGAAVAVLANAGMRGCFDPETEVLTERGWIKCENATKEDTYATVNKDSLEVEWHKPIRMFAYHHEGDMYKVQNDHVDMLVTPNHNMFVRFEDTKFQLIQAQYISREYAVLLSDSELTGYGVVDILVGDSQIINYSGMVYCAEVPNNTLIVRRNGKVHVSGNSRAGTGISRFFSELVEPRKIAKITALLESVGEATDSLVPDEVDLRDMVALLDRLMKERKISAIDISSIFDQRSTRAILSILNQGIDEFDDKLQKIKDSSGLEEIIKEERLNTLMGDYIKFTSAVTTLFVTMGDSTNNALRDVLQYAVHLVRDLTQSFKDSDGSLIKTVASVGAVSAAMGVFATTVGSVIAIVGALGMALAVLGGPLTLITLAAGALLAFRTKSFLDREFQTATEMRKALDALNEKYKHITENTREATKEIDKMREASEKLRRLATMNPLEISRMFQEGENPFDTTELSNRAKDLKQDHRELGREITSIADKMVAIQKRLDKPIASYFISSSVKQELEAELKILEASGKALVDKQKKITEIVRSINDLKDSIRDSSELMTLDYSQSKDALDEVNAKIKEQTKLIEDLKVKAASDKVYEDELLVQEKLLENYESQKQQLIEQVGAHTDVLNVINKVGKLQQEINQLEADGAAAAIIDEKKAKLKEYGIELEEVTKKVKRQKEAEKLLKEADEEIEKAQRERDERGMSSAEKEIRNMEEKAAKEFEAVITSIEANKALLSTYSDDIGKLRKDILRAKAEGDEAEVKKQEEALKNMEGRLKDTQARLDELNQKKQDLPMIQAQEQQEVADKEQLEVSEEIAARINKAALAVAKKTKNMEEELRLTKLIAEAELKREIRDLESKRGVGPQEIAEYKKIREEDIQSDLDDLEASYTTEYLKEIDRTNLEMAKKNNNLAEQIRLTEKLRKEEIARRAAEIGDAKIRKLFEDAENEKLQAELDDLRRSAAKSSPVQSQLGQIESRSDDLLKKRVENHDKIRDALMQQVKTLHDAQMLNAYLYRLERVRENQKAKAAKKALADARRLQMMADKGVSDWALASQFSKAAGSLDAARSAGVSNLALTPAANIIAQNPTNVPNVPPRRQPGGAGTTTINSNNNNVTLESGAIVINGVKDADQLRDEVKDIIQDILNNKKPPKR